MKTKEELLSLAQSYHDLCKSAESEIENFIKGKGTDEEYIILLNKIQHLKISYLNVTQELKSRFNEDFTPK